MAEGPYERVTGRALPGLGSSPAGARYSYRDMGLTNGVTYFYQLEDIETTGVTTFHGPVAATPDPEHAPPETVSEENDVDARLSYGDPAANKFRLVEQRNAVVLELDTHGFTAIPQDDGTVRLEVPGLDEVSGASVPVKRLWIEAIAGRNVEIVSIRARGVERFEGLRPRWVSRSGDRGHAPAARSVRGNDASARRAVRKRTAQSSSTSRTRAMPRKHWSSSPRSRGMTVVSSSPKHSKCGSRFAVARRRCAPGRSPQNGKVAMRLVTVERGLYGVPLTQLPGRGRKALRLSRQGESVPYHVEDGMLYFWSEGALANPFGNEAVYELERGVPGERMEVVSHTGTGGLYWELLEREEERLYQAALLDAPDLWLWDYLLAPERKSFPFEVSGLAATESSHLTIALQGASDVPGVADHHVRAYVNGTYVGESRWDGKTAVTLDAELGAGVLRDGANSLELESVGKPAVAYSMILLDRFDVRYPRPADVLETARFVIDVTGPSRNLAFGLFEDPSRNPAFGLLEDPSPKWVAARNGFEASRTYVGLDSARRPELRRVRSATLRKRWKTDYLVIGPKAFLSAAKPLLRHRKRQGLRVATASTEAIASELGHGELTPESIRELVRIAYGQGRLRYVLLLGDATYDYKDFLQTGVVNHVPPLMVKTSYLWTASDPGYASVNGDDLLPDLAIGRLPVASVDDVRTMIDKILAYETRAAGFRRVTAAIVADNADGGGEFEAAASALANGVLAPIDTKTIFSSELGPQATRDAIVRRFDEGVSLVSYLGHGGIHLWADENIFSTSDVASLSSQSQQPIVLTMNCLNGYFHFPYFGSLAEELVGATGKGAIAAFSPSGLSLNEPAMAYQEKLLEALVTGGHERLGDAILEAQQAYATTGSFPELLRIYHLIGDPALTLR